MKLMMEDVCSEEKPMVGGEIGSYNRKFVEKYGKVMTKIFGKDGCDVMKLSPKAVY